MKKLNLLLITSIANFCLTGCIPAMLYYAAFSVKPYYNNSYIVTEDCAKDAVKAFVTDAGNGGNIKDLILAVKLYMTSVIHHSKDYEGKINTFYISVTDRESYTYAISKNKNNLELVLVAYKKQNGSWDSNVSDSTGIKSHILENCVVND